MTILGKFFRWVSVQFAFLDAKSKKLVPIAVNIVEGIKKVMNNPNTDMYITIAETAIPGNADNVIIDKVHAALHEWLPVILLKLKKVDDIVKIENVTEKLKGALKLIKFSSDEQRAAFWNEAGALMLSKLSGEEITIQDASTLVEDYYQAFVKK